MSIDKLKTKFFTGSFVNDVKHYFTKINEIIDYLNGIGTSGDGSYKVYTALVSQTSTDAPTFIILKNTIGNINWTYDGVGNYYGTLNNAFTINKTFANISQSTVAMGLGSTLFAIEKFDINTLIIATVYDNLQQDGLLQNTEIEIRIYN